MQALFKLATKENHTYLTEGVYYDFKTCEEADIEANLNDGWITDFAKLKEALNKESNDGMQEKGQEAPQVEVKRGRPKNVVD